MDLYTGRRDVLEMVLLAYSVFGQRVGGYG